MSKRKSLHQPDPGGKSLQTPSYSACQLLCTQLPAEVTKQHSVLFGVILGQSAGMHTVILGDFFTSGMKYGQ